MQSGYTLFLSGKIEPRFNDSELAYRVKKIHLLSEVREKMIRSITVSLKLNAIHAELTEELTKLFKQHKGNTLLKIMIYDPDEKIMVSLFSRSIKVEVDKELIRFFNQHPDMEFKIE